MEAGPVIRRVIDTVLKSILIMKAHDTFTASAVKHDRRKPWTTRIHLGPKKLSFGYLAFLIARIGLGMKGVWEYI
tara:strand:+ start:762 stop:986 length:225 start_codon:yes stop_codon:yes gene_type:complete